MKTNEQITTDVTELVKKAVGDDYHYFSDLTVEVEREGDTIKIHVEDMYSSPPFNSGLVFDLVEYFGTKNINSNQFSIEGCETWDYGYSYGYDLIVKGSTI